MDCGADKRTDRVTGSRSTPVRSRSGDKSTNRGNFTTNSNYGNNRNHILSSLATDVQSNNSFFTGITGQGSDEVYALALCRGDLPSEECASCIKSTSEDIMTECPNLKEVKNREQFYIL
ncbi:hypothetical protein Ddye_014539 [Dipteronia dyeriana]|uniref:Gnk2-homologous domain-containing protein n=1 Tax=Dipteronia dyeriana TaxID=168575 RepID=A0AAD9X907_9ROSI|nr:hypothetical protein Ddye_014539 [Dipteronia dyeriana]